MNRSTWVLAVVLVGAASAPAQEAVPWANKFFVPNNAPPVIVHDFGTVPYGTMLSHRFPITNIYAVPMQIYEPRRSCGCVTPTLSTQVLQPRETAWLDVTMDARKFTGPRTVTVYVTFGPQFISTAVLQVKAVSRQDVVITPGQMNFGVVPQGQRPTQTVDVQYSGALDWKITGVAANNAPVDLAVKELVRERNRVVYRVFATVKADAPAGPLQEDIGLQTNDPAGPLLNVNLAGVVQAPLAVVPDAVKFDAVLVGQTVTRRVFVRGSSKPFRILKVEGQGEGLTVELPPAPMSVQIVTIKFQPTQPGELRRQLKFITDLDRDSTATVTVEAAATQ